MLFSDNIPGEILEQPNVSSFVKVLDELQNIKSEVILDFLRVGNYAALLDKKWLFKKLEDFGVNDIPMDYPLPIVQQILLNINTLCSIRGSKIGIEFYCSLLSFGEVEVIDEGFYFEPSNIILDSLTSGFITENTDDKKLYIVEDNEQITPKTSLVINIKSIYFNGDYPNEESTIKGYINKTIRKQLGFNKGSNIEINYSPRTAFYFHKLLNPYFI